MPSDKQKAVDTSIEEAQKNASKRRAKGEFVRGVSGFRSVLGQDADFPAEANRYHLIVALNCPWCHRVSLARNILGLETSISMDVVFPNRTNDDDPAGPNLWEFNPQRLATLTGATLPECTQDTATGQNFRLVKQIYAAEGSNEGSVPILYDKKTQRIVTNESAEIIRMLNQQAGVLGSVLSADQRPNLYPEDEVNQTLRDDIDKLNAQIYTDINNGAYKAGFSSNQNIYATAFENYFATLADLEAALAVDNRPFLTGDGFTEADLRLFPTLYRHDPVYYLRMKLNGAKILDYPHLWRWLCRVYALPGVAASNSLTHCRQGYFGRSWNNVIPLGPTQPMTYPDAYEHPNLAR
ncbi:MAG: glutathione S-transferase C-terminal domain-containing protein [Rhizobiales bacterium]|nr:glutathione S-transferase C-terminal domain-containing protein [Hyphomicrobiales bacterium]NRB15393.1 glutathione S-transferase C-terminal domain-containing protein [Hyphomicrobiales bacterium]